MTLHFLQYTLCLLRAPPILLASALDVTSLSLLTKPSLGVQGTGPWPQRTPGLSRGRVSRACVHSKGISISVRWTNVIAVCTCLRQHQDKFWKCMRAFFSCMAWRGIPNPLSKLHRNEEAEGTSGNRPRTKKVSWDVSVAVGPGPAGLMLEPRQSLVSE